MNDLTMTVTGWVATQPRLVLTRDGSGPPMCTFRLAQTARYFDRNANSWANGQTEWFSVRVFRDGARLVADSVDKGQPVIVEGRLRTNEWTDAQKVTHWGLQLDATSVGHDLTKGVATFTRATVTSGEDEGEAVGQGEVAEPAVSDDVAGDDAAGVVEGQVAEDDAAREIPDDEISAGIDELEERPAALV